MTYERQDKQNCVYVNYFVRFLPATNFLGGVFEVLSATAKNYQVNFCSVLWQSTLFQPNIRKSPTFYKKIILHRTLSFFSSFSARSHSPTPIPPSPPGKRVLMALKLKFSLSRRCIPTNGEWFYQYSNNYLCYNNAFHTRHVSITHVPFSCLF